MPRNRHIMITMLQLRTLQVICLLAGSSNIVGAFRPIGSLRAGMVQQQRRSSSSLSSSLSPPPSSSIPTSSNSTESISSSSVKVIKRSAALIHGPAHAAALENARTGIENTYEHNEGTVHPTHTRVHQAPTPSVDSTDYTKQSISASFSSVSSTQTTKTQERQKPLSAATTAPKPPTTAPKTRRTSAKTKSSATNGPVTIADSIEGLLTLMEGDRSSGALTLVLFHAHYCKICQRATMQMTKAAREYPSVNFAKVESRVIPEPVADNLRKLGVSKFPFVQIFRSGDCVASFSTGPTHLFLRKVRETLDMCLERDDDGWKEFAANFGSEIRENQDARRSLLPSTTDPELMP